MKYYLIAGEASGDLHASNLMKAIKDEDRQARFRFLGGDLMAAEGGRPLRHYRDMAFMGVIPVLLHLPDILRNMAACRKDIADYRPNVVILVDYPGFNLQIARYVKRRLRIPVCYYISPKIWAWKKYRIRSFRRFVDRMFCILPFEKEFFKELNYEAEYVGNPCVDAVERFRDERRDTGNANNTALFADGRPVLALMAGSRKQEISDNLPVMLEAAANFPEYRPVIAGAPGIDPAFYQGVLGNSGAGIVYNQTYALLERSAAALVTSGTATLETTLFRVPQVVCYRAPMAKLVGFIFRTFFHVRYISLVNLIAGRKVVEEFFAESFTLNNVRTELGQILNNPYHRSQMLNGYDEVISRLGKSGASQRAAASITAWLRDKIKDKES
ncbi:MAG: lipid-A-disaccharide synthase [Tannerellaceae bacterium]|jgi:lipid-A-disaccharide synthase|nr:lipid-A-disaccharide synthase [Tannerellaceae bacterium]